MNVRHGRCQDGTKHGFLSEAGGTNGDDKLDAHVTCSLHTKCISVLERAVCCGGCLRVANHTEVVEGGQCSTASGELRLLA